MVESEADFGGGDGSGGDGDFVFDAVGDDFGIEAGGDDEGGAAIDGFLDVVDVEDVLAADEEVAAFRRRS